MSENSDNQIVVGTTEVFYPDRRFSLSKVGRKRLLNRERYLDAVLKILSTSDLYISRHLGVSRMTVYNFRKKNPQIIEEANEILSNMEDISFNRKIEIWENFFNLPVIQEWYLILTDIRRVTEKKAIEYIRAFWKICKYLKMNPRKIDLNSCARLNLELKKLYYNNKKQPYGLSYLRVRQSLRSFFMLIKKISGDHLSSIGITKETIPTYGRFSKQKISPDIRKHFEVTLKKYCKNTNTYLELLNIAKFCYYTGSRINATLRFNFKTHRYNLDKDIWIFEVIDKGRYGGIKWEKYLIGHALREFKEYCSKRFKIPIETLKIELPKKTEYLFPTFIDENGKRKYNNVRVKFKNALIDAGIPYEKFPPTHIWRHTFAQEFLSATNWNYDLCASLGGWKSTYVLKKAYGEMGSNPKINGLRKAMGIPVKMEIHELKW